MALPTPQRMGILAHPLRPQTTPVAEAIARMLKARGIETWLYTSWHETDVVDDVKSSDMVVAIGGDGAMLRAARVCAPHKVPVLGVNQGYLGFLAEINEDDEWQNDLQKIQDGDYWIEERMMLHAFVYRNNEVQDAGHALNDVVISRGEAARIIRLATYIDTEWATTYNADALIIATATGSTAYALAAGGPILPPELRNILIVPVAPHLSMDRPIVLSEGSSVQVIVTEDTRTEVVLAVDGARTANLAPGDRLEVRASKHISRFVRLRERNYFYRSLLKRMEPRFSIRSAPEHRQI